MGSRREEERNEKIIRGLMKLPPNRKCINYNSVGRTGAPEVGDLGARRSLVGFFYDSSASTTGQMCLELPFRYTSLSGDRRRAPFGASFTFLPIDLLDSCNGLLFCRCYHVSHAVTTALPPRKAELPRVAGNGKATG
ncbi:putative ADP-ribosylation factor GTPase-activating protein AGD14 [Hordeum vulgare]|nr:putative ADP-ribosylation factor GTPase-activating protein AGD14 [Hordeum vulgare]